MENITQDQFEDIMFDPDLTIVQKEKTFGKDYHVTTLYVYEVGVKDAISIYEREITASGTVYYKVK